MQQGVKRGSLFISGIDPKVDPPPTLPLAPSWSNFVFCFFLFLAKVNLSNHRNQMCVPLENCFFFHWGAHTNVTTWYLHNFLFDRPVLLCGDQLPELASDIPPTNQTKNKTKQTKKRNKTKKNTCKVTSLASLCLVLDISPLGMNKHLDMFT